MLSFFPRGVLDEILNLIESVSEDFPSYFYRIIHGPSPQAAANGSEADELQEQFNSLKSSLDRVILPPSYMTQDRVLKGRTNLHLIFFQSAEDT